MVTVKSQPNLLEGPLLGKILRFSLPLMLTNLLQTLYSSADLMIVGLSDVPGAVGAIGNTIAMVNLFLNLCVGFSVGTNVVVARDIGAGERGKTQRAVHSSVLVGLIFGLVSCVLGQSLCSWVLTAMGSEGEILRLAVLYCRIYFAGLPFMALTNVFAAILRAKGDTKTPLVVLSLSGLFNVGANLIFVLFCGMSVEGVALATALANVLSAAALLTRLMREKGWCRIVLRKLRLDREAVRDTLYVGIPAGLNSAMFQLSNMQIQSAVIHVNSLLCPGGSAIVDGHAAAYSLEGIVYTVTNSVYQAAITFTSQHFGAGKYKRIGKVMLCCYLCAIAVAVLLGGTVIVFSDALVGLFVEGRAALDAGLIRNKIMLSLYFLVATMDVGTGVLRGMGKSLQATVITLVGVCVLRVLWISILFPLYPTLECIYYSYPCSWLITTIVNIIYGHKVWRKLCKNEV